jgi:hypothetical protein
MLSRVDVRPVGLLRADEMGNRDREELALALGLARRDLDSLSVWRHACSVRRQKAKEFFNA